MFTFTFVDIEKVPYKFKRALDEFCFAIMEREYLIYLRKIDILICNLLIFTWIMRIERYLMVWLLQFKGYGMLVMYNIIEGETTHFGEGNGFLGNA